jgi:hypothetical protein
MRSLSRAKRARRAPQIGRFSNRPFGIKRFQAIYGHHYSVESLTASRFSSESALGRSIMGFEDEMEQSSNNGPDQLEGVRHRSGASTDFGRR